MPETAQRRQLGAFLRSRRERLTPADVGLPPSARRRTPGLRREETALLAGVSVTWYTWLEQARDIVVSRQVLDGIATALRLTVPERRHLFALAGQALPAGWPATPPSPVVRRLVETLDPHPTYVTNARGDLLAWNRAHTGLLGDHEQRAESERNIVWLLFTDPRLRTMITEWRRLALTTLTQHRAETAQHRGDARFAELTEALRDASTEFREWWDNDTLADFQPAHWEFNHARLGTLSFDYLKLATNAEPDLKITTALPADSETAGKIARLPALG